MTLYEAVPIDADLVPGTELEEIYSISVSTNLVLCIVLLLRQTFIK